jgi:hypothetical protein
MITQVVKADANGVFTYGVPFAGWWGFAALNTAKKRWTMKARPRTWSWARCCGRGSLSPRANSRTHDLTALSRAWTHARLFVMPRRTTQ